MLRLSGRKVVILFRLPLNVEEVGGGMCNDSVVKTSRDRDKYIISRKKTGLRHILVPFRVVTVMLTHPKYLQYSPVTRDLHLHILAIRWQSDTR